MSACATQQTGAPWADAPAQQHVELRRVRANGDQGHTQPGPPGGGPDREDSRHGQEAQEKALQAHLSNGTFSIVLLSELASEIL